MLGMAVILLLLNTAGMVSLVCRSCGLHEHCWLCGVCWCLNSQDSLSRLNCPCNIYSRVGIH